MQKGFIGERGCHLPQVLMDVGKDLLSRASWGGLGVSPSFFRRPTTSGTGDDTANHLSRSPRCVCHRPNSSRRVQPPQWWHPTSSSKLETDGNRTRWPTDHWFHWFPMDCEEAANTRSLGACNLQAHLSRSGAGYTAFFRLFQPHDCHNHLSRIHIYALAQEPARPELSLLLSGRTFTVDGWTGSVR